MSTEQVQTLQLNEKKLVGFSVTVSLNQDLENGIVVNLREELISKRSEITNRVDEGIYLVQVYPDCDWTPDVPFESIVAVEVTGDRDTPEGFIQYTIPAGDFAKFTHRGPESELGETYDAIRETGIAALRPFDFEYWADSNALEQDESTIDIYLPLDA
ncbi:GyrI-like domain-containing protein [Paenibacillus sp. SC116]|uniref:GyrI-like domain-containing protein n=1 Tax=Paenibacillus sp. SC116 TaxID=2968986 RepID=UPI00215B58E2|nr:GyrI-like domain-containing protein [Paenibacillus sp. SC116]MCR8842367.1 GyrI-like domain-containing protein [Paenibacillus sp. SC116]